MTITTDPSSGYPFDWITGVAIPVTYSPADFVTYPAPLTTSTIYYTIPVDSTHIKLATSVANAQAGTAINLTSAGSLPGLIVGSSIPGDNAEAIEHNVGYPPTYMLARVSTINGEHMVYPLNRTNAMVKSDAKYLRLGGVQAIISGEYAYVVLKDPAELVL